MAEKSADLSLTIFASAAVIAVSMLLSSLIEIGNTRWSPIGTWEPIGIEKGAGWIVNTQTGQIRACWLNNECYVVNK